MVQDFTCPYCKTENRSPFLITEGSNVYFDDFETQCVGCGKMFQPLPDGGYDFDKEGNAFPQGLLAAVKEANLSTTDLLKIYNLAQSASKGRMPKEGFTAVVNEIAPSLGEKLNTYFGNNQYSMTFLQTLMAILATLLSGYALLKPDTPPQTTINNYNYYGSSEKPKTEQVHKPKPGKLGSNITLPKKPRKKRGKRA